jgi:CHRD domain/PEP-CTERM motif
VFQKNEQPYCIMKALLFFVALFRTRSKSHNPIKALLFIVFAVSLIVPAHAATILFDLQGKAGSGLLSGNENVAISGNPGTGGELGSGIRFDDSTMILSIFVGWGSVNGFTDLTGNTTLGHLHGPTTSGGTAAFTQNANVRYTLHTLPEWNSSASAGGFNGSIAIQPGDVAALLNGQFYFNAHTSLNPNGEIRGQLVVVPEPSTWALFVLGAGGLLCWKQRRKN